MRAPTRTRETSTFGLAILLCALVGCAKSRPQQHGAAPAPSPSPTATVPDGAALTVVPHAQGTIKKDLVEAAFKARDAQIADCARKHAVDLPWVGGQLVLKVRSGQKGEVTAVQVVEPLGNADVEGCVIGVVRGIVFEAPMGGEFAETTQGFTLAAARPAEAWGSEEVARVFAANRAALDKCAASDVTGGVPKTLRVSLFIGAGGSVLSTTVGADDPMSDAYVRCVIGEVKGWKFNEPHGKGAVARATYRF
jgi:hypothetical protein